MDEVVSRGGGGQKYALCYTQPRTALRNLGVRRDILYGQLANIELSVLNARRDLCGGCLGVFFTPLGRDNTQKHASKKHKGGMKRVGVLFGTPINREAPYFLAKAPNMHMVRPKNVGMRPRPVLRYARCGSHTPHTPHDQSIHPVDLVFYGWY
jgi:hypothetical protein